jgi:hypothetical protein
MCTTGRFVLFTMLYIALFVGAMATITGGVIDVAAWSSAPVILTADGLILGMIYMTTFHGEGEEHDATFQAPKLTHENCPLRKLEKALHK